MDKLSRSYQDELLKALTDPEEAAAYLNAALDEGDSELFLLALGNVAEARHMKKQGKTVSLSDLTNILDNMGLRFAAKSEMQSRQIAMGERSLTGCLSKTY